MGAAWRLLTEANVFKLQILSNAIGRKVMETSAIPQKKYTTNTGDHGCIHIAAKSVRATSIPVLYPLVDLKQDGFHHIRARAHMKPFFGASLDNFG